MLVPVSLNSGRRGSCIVVGKHFCSCLHLPFGLFLAPCLFSQTTVQKQRYHQGLSLPPQHQSYSSVTLQASPLLGSAWTPALLLFSWQSRNDFSICALAQNDVTSTERQGPGDKPDRAEAVYTLGRDCGGHGLDQSQGRVECGRKSSLLSASAERVTARRLNVPGCEGSVCVICVIGGLSMPGWCPSHLPGKF